MKQTKKKHEAPVSQWTVYSPLFRKIYDSRTRDKFTGRELFVNVLRGGCQGIYRLRPRSFATRRPFLCIHLRIKCSYMKTEDFKVRLKVSTFFDLWVIILFVLIILSLSILPSPQKIARLTYPFSCTGNQYIEMSRTSLSMIYFVQHMQHI